MIDYPHGSAPRLGEPVRVAPGVFWLRMPLPFALDHINLWVLEDGDGFTLVDSGIDLPSVREAWERVAATLFPSRPPLRLICTHFHPPPCSAPSLR